MKAFQEITEWDCDFAVPNHVYFLSDSKDKMYGYVKAGTGKIQEMGTPYRFKVSGRRFKEVANTWGFLPKEEQESKPTGRSWQVAGSQGNSYTVSLELGSWSCTCTGFKYHGTCRHIKSTQSQNT